MRDAARQPWDRLPAEPAKWFERFERYRLLPPATRSVAAVYHQETGTNRHKPVRPNSWWRDRSRHWHWRERAEAWDASQREQRRVQDEAAYRAALDKHRDNALKLSQVALNNAVRLLAKMDARLQALEVNDITPALLSGYLRAAAAVAEAALNGEAQALAVDQLVRQLDGNSDLTTE